MTDPQITLILSVGPVEDSAIAGLMIEDTSDLSPAPFVAVMGVFTGVSVMMLVRKTDERDR